MNMKQSEGNADTQSLTVNMQHARVTNANTESGDMFYTSCS